MVARGQRGAGCPGERGIHLLCRLSSGIIARSCAPRMSHALFTVARAPINESGT